MGSNQRQVWTTLLSLPSEILTMTMMMNNNFMEPSTSVATTDTYNSDRCLAHRVGVGGVSDLFKTTRLTRGQEP